MNWIFDRLGISLTLLFLVVTVSTPSTVDAQQNEEGSEENELLKEGLPLTPQRTLKGSFTEGSWISLDVSPDGGTIVFDFL